MSALKNPIGIDVLTATRRRIAFVFDRFERVYVSFSGGKDSTVMLHLVIDEARARGRRVGVLFIDWEAQYRLTMEHVTACFADYADTIEPYWIALPLTTPNAVSQFEPEWVCWEPGKTWVRDAPPLAITDGRALPFYRDRMSFEEFVPAFAQWYARDRSTACLVGIRSDESLNRFRTLIADKTTFEGRAWTTWMSGAAWNVYPIYDWRTEDIWTWHGHNPGRRQNAIYDRMRLAGVPLHNMRICEPYGPDQRRGLWLYHLLEPETWGRVVARVAGANGGALYAGEAGNILGNRMVEKPEGHTWRSFAHFLLDTMPAKTAEHYRAKFAVYLKWYADRDYPDGNIPDEQPKDLGSKDIPSWRRLCRVLLRNDYWCKALYFGPTKTHAYANYLEIMKRRRAKWGLI